MTDNEQPNRRFVDSPPSSVARLLSSVLDWLLPPLCLNCHEPVASHQALCPDCWKTISFIAPPLCARCGMPFDLPVEEETLCGACLAQPPVFNRARSAIIYNDASKNLILSFKHGDRLHHIPALVSWMLGAAADLLPATDIIVPVPLHRWRLFQRRYNQAALLAQGLGKKAGKRVIADALQRARWTPSQGTMNREQRKKNLSGAIRLNATYADVLKKKNVLLVDDVFTTGATVDACSRVLLGAGAARVDVLTLMRTRSCQ